VGDSSSTTANVNKLLGKAAVEIFNNNNNKLGTDSAPIRPLLFYEKRSNAEVNKANCVK